MNRTREFLSETPERGLDDRLDDFRNEVGTAGRGELADKLIASLDSPGSATLILKPARSYGWRSEDIVRKLAEAALDEPRKQFERVNCYWGVESANQELFGYYHSHTEGYKLGVIDSDEMRICLVENFDRLEADMQDKLLEEAIPNSKAVFYLTSYNEENTNYGGISEAARAKMGMVYQQPDEFPTPELRYTTSAQDPERQEHPEEGETLKFREAIAARLVAAVDLGDYQKALTEFDAHLYKMVAQPGLGTPEQRAEGNRLSKKAYEAADQAETSCKKLARHPKEKLRNVARHGLEVIEATRPLGLHRLS